MNTGCQLNVRLPVIRTHLEIQTKHSSINVTISGRRSYGRRADMI